MITSSCNTPKEKPDNLEQKLKPVAIKTNKNDSVKYSTEKKGIQPPIPVPPKLIVVKLPYNKPIKCFNPNLRIDDAIELINSGVENTQWFLVERKEVDYHHTKLDQTDTIWIKEKLLKTDWKLIDSSQINIGNQNKITFRMQKENRICTIEKKLYLADKKNDNYVDEWFQIREIKSETK